MEQIHLNPFSSYLYAIKEKVNDLTVRVCNFVTDFFKAIFSLQYCCKAFTATSLSSVDKDSVYKRREWLSKISTCSMESVLPYIDGLIKAGIVPDAFDNIIFIFLCDGGSHRTFATDGLYSQYVNIIEASAPNKCLIVGITDKEFANGSKSWRDSQISMPLYPSKLKDCEYLWSENGKDDISQFVEDYKALISGNK